MRPADFNKIYETILELAESRLIWPDPTEALMQGNKILYTQDLANVATRVTKTWYPLISIVPEPTKIKWSHNFVLKRTYSDTGEHVIHRYTKDRSKKISRLASDTEVHYNGVEIKGMKIRPTWFAVPFIPMLRHLGEIRTFFIRGKPMYFVFTRQDSRGNWIIQRGHQVTPLDCLSYV